MDARRPDNSAAHRSPSRRGRSRTRPRRGAHHTAVYTATAAAALSIAAALIVAAACSPEAKHRTLVFFFDGVPPLDAGLAMLGGETSGIPPAAEMLDELVLFAAGRFNP